jgi:hypothetical protein
VTYFVSRRDVSRAIHAHSQEPDLLNTLAIRNQKNFAAGLLYIGAGGAFAIGAFFYNMGSAARMGPGYFPFWLGLLLAAIGLVVLASSMRPRSPPGPLPKFDWKVLAWILASVASFGVLLTPLGLVISLLVLVLVASRASHEFRWKGAVLNALLLVAMCLGAFVWGLGLQLPLWPSFID